MIEFLNETCDKCQNPGIYNNCHECNKMYCRPCYVRCANLCDLCHEIMCVYCQYEFHGMDICESCHEESTTRN